MRWLKSTIQKEKKNGPPVPLSTKSSKKIKILSKIDFQKKLQKFLKSTKLVPSFLNFCPIFWHIGVPPLIHFVRFLFFQDLTSFCFFRKNSIIKIELKNLKKFISRADCKRSTLFFLVYLVGFDIVLFEFDDLTDDEDFQNDWWLGKPVPNQEIAVF